MQNQMAQQSQQIATLQRSQSFANLPNTNLLSPNFMTRAFAVWSHFFVSNLIIAIVINCILEVLFLLNISDFRYRPKRTDRAP